MPCMDGYQIASGFVVGLLVGVTGVGGGSLMTPLLTLGFGYAPTIAVGTDLAFAAVTKGVGTVAHGVHGQVHWCIVRRLCAGSLPAALLTRSEEHTSELQSLMRISYAVFCLKKKNT